MTIIEIQRILGFIEFTVFLNSPFTSQKFLLFLG